MIYVTTMNYGAYDDWQSVNVYAGSSLEMAYAAAEEFEFPDDCTQYGYVQCWRDGVIVEDIMVREYDQMYHEAVKRLTDSAAAIS